MAYTDLFSFYRSPEWEGLRKRITLERVDNMGDLHCEHCGKVLIHPYEAICHHVEELTEENVFDALVALNPDNIQVVCHRCHNKHHERWGYASRVKRVCVVWGSPCSGKRSFVAESAGPNDLIVDIDSIYDALSTGEYRGSITGNVMAVYRTLIDQVKTRNGRWRTAWILRTLPLNIDRESLGRELGGPEMIHIDTDMAACLEEAESRGGDWPKWTEEYWKKYQPPE